MSTPTSGYVYSTDDEGWKESACSHLRSQGFVVLRGCVSSETLSAANEKIELVLSKPSLGGSVGYYMKDPYKKMFDGLLIGKAALDIVANLKVIELVEEYLEEEVLISEVFLKNDLGSGQTYFPYHCHTGDDLEHKSDEGPFGCGTMCYMYDTEEGAFCYSPETHKLGFPHGADPSKYPEPLKSRILDNMVRVSGKAGDIVVFDEAGFHGPEQPVRTPRTVLLYGYQNKKFSNNTVRNPTPVVLSDLRNLSGKQLDVLGINSGARQSFYDYHVRGFDKHPSYPRLRRAFDNHFRRDAASQSFRRMIRSLWTKQSQQRPGR